MTLFNSDPYKINDINELREMVDLLQKANNNLQHMQSISRELQDMLYKVNVHQGERIERLYEQIELLASRTENLQQGVVNNRPEQPLRQN